MTRRECEVKAATSFTVASKRSRTAGWQNESLARQGQRIQSMGHDSKRAMGRDSSCRPRHQQGEGLPYGDDHGIRAFLPGLLAISVRSSDTSRSRTRRSLKASSSDRKPNNVVVSRRARCSRRAKGEVRETSVPAVGRRGGQGIVKTITDYGASSTWRHRRTAHINDLAGRRVSSHRKCSRWATKSPPRSSSSTRKRIASRWA